MEPSAFGINTMWTIAFTAAFAMGGTASGAHEDSEPARDMPSFFFDWDEVRAADSPLVAHLEPGPAGTCSGEIRSHVQMGSGEAGIKRITLRPIAGERCAFEARALKYEGLEADAYRFTTGVPILGGTSPCLEAMGCVPAKAPWEHGARRGMVQDSVPAHWPGPSIN